MQAASEYNLVDEGARPFVETYLNRLIDVLVHQPPSKIGYQGSTCVKNCLLLAVLIVAKDLTIQHARNGECVLLNTLALVFDLKTYNNCTRTNCKPEERLDTIQFFQLIDGFATLSTYLESRVDTPMAVKLDLLLPIVSAIADIELRRVRTPQSIDEYDSELVGRAVMKCICSLSDELMCLLHIDVLKSLRFELRCIFDRLILIKREECYRFYCFWRDLVLRLIHSKSDDHMLFGWVELEELIGASREHRPPPKAFEVSGAGVAFVNGLYTFCGTTTADGYADKGHAISYVRRVQPDEKEGSGKIITLFRCIIRSKKRRWFLSEADDEHPGTDRDIDYYQHKGSVQDDSEPPCEGWEPCCGMQPPPPRLKGAGSMVPEGQEYNSLEHQLAKWAMDNKIFEKIIELLVGSSRLCNVEYLRKASDRAISCIKFLAEMCTRDETQADAAVTHPGPNAYCLQESHLLLAWRACTNAELCLSHLFYDVFVAILPSLPNTMSICLLQAVQQSNFLSAELFCTKIVIEFQKCRLLVSDEVQSAIFDLTWAVVRHSCYFTLKNYHTLMRFAITCPASAAA